MRRTMSVEERSLTRERRAIRAVRVTGFPALTSRLSSKTAILTERTFLARHGGAALPGDLALTVGIHGGESSLADPGSPGRFIFLGHNTLP